VAASASHTGRQYCAVDSITTSSTSCALSQAARPRRSLGVVPTFWRSKWKSPSISTSATTTASILLWTSIPAIRYGIGLSLGRAESVPRHISQGRGLSSAPAESNDAQLFVQSRTLRTKQLLGLTGSTGLIRSHRSRRRYSAASIFIAFRGPEAHPNQLRKSSSAASQPPLTLRVSYG
jgi:hypothetical protein